MNYVKDIKITLSDEFEKLLILMGGIVYGETEKERAEYGIDAFSHAVRFSNNDDAINMPILVAALVKATKDKDNEEERQSNGMDAVKTILTSFAEEKIKSIENASVDDQHKAIDNLLDTLKGKISIEIGDKPVGYGKKADDVKGE